MTSNRQFTPFTYTFDEIYFRLSITNNDGPAYLDDVQVTTNVPEPTSVCVAGLIGVGLLRRVRRRG